MYDNNKEIIKNSLDKILLYYGATPGKNNWQCIPGRHETPNYDLSVKEKICCCHCGIQGDSFNVISIMENLSLKDDFKKIIKKGLNIIGEKPSNVINIRRPTKNNNNYESKSSIQNKLKNSLTNIIQEKYNKSNKVDYSYFLNRGISSIELYKKHKFIIGNPRKIFPANILPNISNIYAYEYIIPIWQSGEVLNCVLRRNDELSRLNKKTMNLKGLPVEIFNIDYLKESIPAIIFITEGIFDALSFENEGFNAIALNSVVMINKFISLVKENIDNLLNKQFFIALDNDKAGDVFSKNLIHELKNLNLRACNLKLDKYKDINEYYILDYNSFRESLDQISNLFKKKDMMVHV